MLGDAGERCGVFQQGRTYEIERACKRPGEVLGKALRRVAVAQRFQPSQVLAINGCIEPIDNATPWMDSA